MNIATRVDFQTELDAADKGECLLCRISVRHPDDSDCPRAPELNAFWNRHQTGVKYGPFVEGLINKGRWSDMKALKDQLNELEYIRRYGLEVMTREEQDIVLMDLYLVNCRITRLTPGDCNCHHYGRPGWKLINNAWTECPDCNPQLSLVG